MKSVVQLNTLARLEHDVSATGPGLFLYRAANAKVPISPHGRRVPPSAYRPTVTRHVPWVAPAPSLRGDREAEISAFGVADDLKRSALDFCKLARPARAAAGSDGSLMLYFFGAALIVGGAHARHASVTFEGDGACFALVDTDAQSSEVFDLDVSTSGAMALAAERSVRF